jgi:hypothetical protein
MPAARGSALRDTSMISTDAFTSFAIRRFSFFQLNFLRLPMIFHAAATYFFTLPEPRSAIRHIFSSSLMPLAFEFFNDFFSFAYAVFRHSEIPRFSLFIDFAAIFHFAFSPNYLLRVILSACAASFS